MIDPHEMIQQPLADTSSWRLELISIPVNDATVWIPPVQITFNRSSKVRTLKPGSTGTEISR